MKHYVFILFIVLFGCSTSPDDIITEAEQHANETYPQFSGFPLTVYQELQPGILFEDLHTQLQSNNWRLDNKNENCHFFNPADSTTVIIPNYEHQPNNLVQSYKLFLRSSVYLNDSEKFISHLEKSALTTRQSESLYLMSYDDLELSVFKQPTYIRLFVIKP